MATGNGLLETWRPVAPLVLRPYFSSIHSITLEQGLRTTQRLLKVAVLVSSNGLVDVYRKTLASDGFSGLYRGFVPSVVGIIVYRGLYFGVYDSLSELLRQQPRTFFLPFDQSQSF